jgi:hypothetical protein
MLEFFNKNLSKRDYEKSIEVTLKSEEKINLTSQEFLYNSWNYFS